MRRRLVLASQSPRRTELLQKAGFRFSIVAARAAELTSPALTARELTLLNALRKGRSVLSEIEPGAIVLAADTLVEFRGEFLGKPADLGAAKGMLQRLNGKRHRVHTGVYLAEASGKYLVFVESSAVTFKKLSEKGIARYLARVNPLDKAGAYAAQEEGASIIRKIEGSRTNVIGLPLRRTIRALAKFGIRAG